MVESNLNKDCIALATNNSMTSVVAAFPIIGADNSERCKGDLLINCYEESVTESITIDAFNKEISHIELDVNGERIAVANITSIIRIISYKGKEILYQFKRLFLNAEIYRMEFDPTGVWFCIADTRSDLEIFFVKHVDEHLDRYNTITNRESSLSFLKNFIPYFSNQWSFAHFKDTKNVFGTALFGENGNIKIFSANGSVQQVAFDLLHGGSCREINYNRNFVLENE